MTVVTVCTLSDDVTGRSRQHRLAVERVSGRSQSFGINTTYREDRDYGGPAGGGGPSPGNLRPPFWRGRPFGAVARCRAEGVLQGAALLALWHAAGHKESCKGLGSVTLQNKHSTHTGPEPTRSLAIEPATVASSWSLCS